MGSRTPALLALDALLLAIVAAAVASGCAHRRENFLQQILGAHAYGEIQKRVAAGQKLHPPPQPTAKPGPEPFVSAEFAPA
jgi:hypothetical protein